MSARDKLYAYAGTPSVLPEGMLDPALDAYRAEVRREAFAEAADGLENLLAEHESSNTSCHDFGLAIAQLYRQWRTERSDEAAPRPDAGLVMVCTFDDNGQPLAPTLVAADPSGRFPSFDASGGGAS